MKEKLTIGQKLWMDVKGTYTGEVEYVGFDDSLFFGITVRCINSEKIYRFDNDFKSSTYSKKPSLFLEKPSEFGDLKPGDVCWMPLVFEGRTRLDELKFVDNSCGSRFYLKNGTLRSEPTKQIIFRNPEDYLKK